MAASRVQSLLRLISSRANSIKVPFLMRFILGFLSGVLGLLAGWFGLAMLVIALAGPGRDGGIAMGAFFNVGPFGGIAGFVAGVVLFIKFGLVAQTAPPRETEQSDGTPVRAQPRVSRIFAAAVLAITAGLSWWGWYELIRSPYLSHGYMTLQLQFRLPSGMALPSEPTDVHIAVEEGQQSADVMLGRAWHGTDGDHRVILASTTLSMKTRRRVVTLELLGVPEQSWQLDLSNDPDPTPGYSSWRLSIRPSAERSR